MLAQGGGVPAQGVPALQGGTPAQSGAVMVAEMAAPPQKGVPPQQLAGAQS